MSGALFALLYGFGAWLASGVFVWLGYKLPWRTAQVAVHAGAVILCFYPALRAYFARPDAVGPTAAAGLIVAMIVALDITVVAPCFAGGSRAFFRSFWDWQLPAIVLIATIFLAARGR